MNEYINQGDDEPTYCPECNSSMTEVLNGDRYLLCDDENCGDKIMLNKENFDDE